MKENQAYDLGRDAAKNGANTENSNFAIFSTPEGRDEWQKGYDDYLKENPRN